MRRKSKVLGTFYLNKDDQILIGNEKVNIKRYLRDEKPEYYFERIGMELKTDKNKYIIIGVAVILLIFFIYLLF